MADEILVETNEISGEKNLEISESERLEEVGGTAEYSVFAGKAIPSYANRAHPWSHPWVPVSPRGLP